MKTIGIFATSGILLLVQPAYAQTSNEKQGRISQTTELPIDGKTFTVTVTGPPGFKPTARLSIQVSPAKMPNAKSNMAPDGPTYTITITGVQPSPALKPDDSPVALSIHVNQVGRADDTTYSVTLPPAASKLPSTAVGFQVLDNGSTALDIARRYWSHCELAKGSASVGLFRYLKFGADGPSVLAQNSCSSSADSGPNTDVGAQSTPWNVAYAYDGTQKKDTINVVGAIGLNLFTRRSINLLNSSFPKWLEGLSIYTKLDYESNATSSQKTSYNQQISEFGIIAESDYRATNFLTRITNPIFGITSDKTKLERDRLGLPDPNREDFLVYYQGFELRDNLRHSQLEGGKLRLTPVVPGVNEYFSSLATPNWIYLGLIADARIDYGHFSEVGLPLAQIVGNSSKNGNSNTLTYLPNEDFVRFGGRLGAFTQIFLPAISAKPISTTAYIADFTAIQGYHHDLGQIVGSVKIPIGGELALGVTYSNGRSEIVAARNESIKVGLTLSTP